jgi:hypothetical protein
MAIPRSRLTNGAVLLTAALLCMRAERVGADCFGGLGQRCQSDEGEGGILGWRHEREREAWSCAQGLGARYSEFEKKAAWAAFREERRKAREAEEQHGTTQGK